MSSMRNRLDEALEEMNNNLIEMGTNAEISIERAALALKNQDMELAQSVEVYKKRVEEIAQDIEYSAHNILLLQQPVAQDMRFISAALRIVTDIERIATQTMNISEITMFLIGKTFIKSPEPIVDMAEKAIFMVHRAIDAFVTGDAGLAAVVIEYDDTVDDLFILVRDELITMINEDKSNGEQAIDLIMIAKYLERIADHAVNISKWVIFSISNYSEVK